MRMRLISLLMLMFIPLWLCGQAAGDQEGGGRDSLKFAGVWRGQLDGLPAVDLVINDEGGELHGAVLFYLHMRQDRNKPYTSTPGLPEPIFDLKQEGRTLRFEVSHRRAHPPATLHDPPMMFHLRFTEPGRAELVNETESGPRVVLTRSDD
jgi:hypothetical protein